MSKKGGKTAQPYNFAAEFERAVVYLACSDHRFLARTAHALDFDLLAQPEHRIALKAAQGILRDTGRGPTTFRALVQRVARLRDEGKISHEEVMAVSSIPDLFDAEAPPRAEQYEAELVATLRKRIRHEVAQAAIDESRKDSWENVRRLMSSEELLGKTEVGVGVRGDRAGIQASLSELMNMQRVPLGIQVLDETLGGGVPRGSLTCFMAGPGGGKSMALSHVTTQLARRQMFVAYATLELPVAYVMARYSACLTGVTIKEMEKGLGFDEFAQRTAMEQVTSPVFQSFTPHATTVDALKDWVKRTEDSAGQAIDALVVDYADKLTATGKVDERGMYHEMRIVFEEFRVWMEERKMLGLTATQSRSRDEKKAKKIDIEHTADSMHKVRIVDQFITINYDDETQEVSFFTAKNRHGEGRKTVGPIPSNYACGQIAPVERAALPVIRRAPVPIPAREPGSDDGDAQDAEAPF